VANSLDSIVEIFSIIINKKPAVFWKRFHQQKSYKGMQNSFLGNAFMWPAGPAAAPPQASSPQAAAAGVGVPRRGVTRRQ
jgi:hypothetical protein